MISEMKKQMKRYHIINELAKRFDYHNVDEKDDEQLINILTHLRATEINHEHPSDKWF